MCCCVLHSLHDVLLCSTLTASCVLHSVGLSHFFVMMGMHLPTQPHLPITARMCALHFQGGRPGSGGPRRVAGSAMTSDAAGYLAETLGLDRAECEVRCVFVCLFVCLLGCWGSCLFDSLGLDRAECEVRCLFVYLFVCWGCCLFDSLGLDRAECEVRT
jgi:hypothetical protein